MDVCWHTVVIGNGAVAKPNGELDLANQILACPMI